MNNNQPMTRREFLKWIFAVDKNVDKLNKKDLVSQK